MMRQILQAAALASAVCLVSPAPPAAALDLTSVKVQESASLPKIKPNWPVPRDRNQVFYLQRSTNRNTIVYTARFDDAGNIDSRQPAAVHWRRFNDGGEAKALKRIEHVLYGLNSRKGAEAGDFTISLKRLPQIPMLLRQTGPNQAELYARIGGKIVQPVYAYADVDQSGLIDRLTAFTLVGRDPATGGYIAETFSVTGGAIRP